MRPFIEAVRPLFPFLTLFIVTTAWVLLSQNDIITKEPRMLFLLFGTIFSNISVTIWDTTWYNLKFYMKMRAIYKNACIFSVIVPTHCCANVRHPSRWLESFNLSGHYRWQCIMYTATQIQHTKYWCAHRDNSCVFPGCRRNTNTFSFWLWSGKLNSDCKCNCSM